MSSRYSRRSTGSSFPSITTRARGSGDRVLVVFDSRLQQLPPRWQGANTGHYANPRLDALIDRLAGAIELREQSGILRDIGELMASDLPAAPIYFRTGFAAVRSGVRALVDDYSGIKEAGDMARHAYRWDRDPR